MNTMRVMVIGGGCAGTLAARALEAAGARVVVIDPAARLGPGLAYGAAEEWHLLNAPAAAMSAAHGDPGHFVRWCRSRGLNVDGGEFLPRPLYGRYLADLAAPLDHRRSWARQVRGAAVELADGTTLPADAVVLALGNRPPARIPGAHVQDPWAPGALDTVDGPVALLGTGLTAIDVTLTLIRRGAGPVVALSRHGLLPQPHLRIPLPKADVRLPAGSRSLAQVVRDVRALARQVPDWRQAVDALRPITNDLWQALDDNGRDRFVRHLARYWEVHRHRIAPGVAAQLEALKTDGRLVIRAGTVRDVPAGHTIVNCTGPVGQPFRARADGSVPDGPMWTLGPPRRGPVWETTAVAEIRAQAAALPEQILGRFTGSRTAAPAASPSAAIRSG
jgi:uncharacterized NAD(P)/FAD-binding protein YdhS